MKALFYDKSGKVVWECTKNAVYHFNNGTKAIRKGAVRGELYLPGMGEPEQKMDYHVVSMISA